MRFRRPEGKYIVMVVLTALVAMNYIKHSKVFSGTLLSPLQNWRSTEDVQLCKIPDIDPFTGEYAKFFHDVQQIKCSEEPDWISIKNGTVYVTPEIAKKYGEIECILTYFERKDDFQNKNISTVLLHNTDIVTLLTDFFMASCKSLTVKASYSNIHAGIAFRKLNTFRNRRNVTGLGLDVLMLGFDSLSHATYRRKLKKTYEYFTKILNGDVLNGYNIVGDGTPQALIPILTGKTELELPRTLKRLKKKEFVDVYPMIWKDFQKEGYVTAFTEDAPHIGTFTYRMVGFKTQPTHHYMRPFYLAASEEYHKHKKYCLGSKRRTKIFLDWLLQFYIEYKDHPKFLFGFHNELSHVDNNLVQMADDDIVEFLSYLYENNYLKNTMLILMSDHGARFSHFRSSFQGKLEERLPFFGFSFPGWFKVRYKQMYNNFRSNINRLTSPFDIHPTFLDVLGYPNPQSVRSISLFKPISKSRTCVDAGIEAHWCACLAWKSVSTSVKEIMFGAQYAINKINSFTKSQRKLCLELQLKTILSAHVLQAEENMLKFKSTNDADGFAGDLTGKTEVHEVKYQIVILTFPNNGLYELTFQHDIDNNTFRLQESDISRINRYGNDSICIQEKYDNMRKYCYCKR